MILRLMAIIAALTINERGCIEGELAHMKQHGKEPQKQVETPPLPSQFEKKVGPPYPARFEP